MWYIHWVFRYQATTNDQGGLMRTLMVLVLGIALLAGPALAGCPLAENGEHKATLTAAAKALEASDPALAAKVKDIAETCCKAEAKAAAPEHPAHAEHPMEHPA
jgi:outer membrane murein-binding lipoprotein Lpp